MGMHAGAAWLRRLLPERGPARLLALATLVDTVGKGLFMSASAIFYTRSVGLSVRELGIGLTVAAAAGFVASTPLGYVADRRGPREVLIAMLLVQSAATAALALVGSFWAFLLVTSLITICARGSGAARGALIAGLLPPDKRVRIRAYLRAVTNVGISAGTVFAGLALQVDTRTGYLTLIAGDAASFAVVAAIMCTLPRLPPVPAPRTGPRMIVLRDRPFLVYTALHGVLALHYGLLMIAVPIWITLRTDAPRSIVAALFLLNGVTVVVLQVRVSRGTELIAPAAQAHLRAGLLLGVACVLYALSGGRSAWVASVVLFAAAFVHVLGELLQSAGSFGLSYALAPDHAQGQYQGGFDMGFSLANMAGPLVVTALAVEWGLPGWLLLGAVFVASGALVPPVARWAQRSRAAVPTAGNGEPAPDHGPTIGAMSAAD